MQFTIKQALDNIAAGRDREAVARVLRHIGSRLSTQMLSSAGLVIKAGGGVLAKSGATDAYALVGGALVKLTAGTDMPALTGLSISANMFNVACFLMDAGGTRSVLFGREGGSIASLKWPDLPPDQVLIGALLITHNAAFTGGTTALDTATTVYLSPIGAVDPTVLYS